MRSFKLKELEKQIFISHEVTEGRGLFSIIFFLNRKNKKHGFSLRY